MVRLKHLLSSVVFLLAWNSGWGQNHFAVTSSTVALWTFNSHNSGTFADSGHNAFNLSNANNFALTPAPYDSAAIFTGTASVANSFLSHVNATALTIAGTGQITYEARIYLSANEPANRGWLLGTYDGVILQISPAGQLNPVGQRVSGGAGYWIGAESVTGVIPLNQWVDIAVSFDQATGQIYGYVNGTPVQLYNEVGTITDPFRVSNGSFFVGSDGQDNDQFAGTIDEIRVSNTLVLGTGFPLINGYPPTVISNLTYSQDTAAYATNLAIVNNAPSVSGTAASYAVNPALPAGLSLNTTTGVISGTPTTPTATANYTVTVTGTGNTGTTSVVLTLTVGPGPSGLSYSTNPAAYYVGTVIVPNTPSVTGTVTSYSVSPALPAGLTFNTTTGVISGTPTAAAVAANYTIKAFDGLVSTSVSVNITVVAAPTSLSYSANPATYGMGVAITSNNPTVSGTAPITYSVNPALPAGMVLNATTGVISGTPTQSAPTAGYTVTASNGYGSTTAVINIAVIPPPANLSYSLSPAYYLVNAAITPNTPTVTGTVSSYSINPALPTGLTLNTSTGVISGTPVLPVSNNFTITASNIAGPTTVVVNLTVSLPLSNLSYSANPASYFVATAITANTPSITGSAPIAYSVNPALPAGLTLNTSTGVITGTPATFAATANYTITASNPSSGITSVVLTLAVNSAISILQWNSSQSFTVMVSQSPAVKFELPSGNTAQRATVEILDMNGSRMWEGNANLGASENSLAWNGATNGRSASGGIYFARMTLWDANQKEIKAINKKFVYLP